MRLFKPATLLDKTYEIGIVIKGIDGLVELVGGVLVLLVPRGTIEHLTSSLTQHELATDPHDFLASHLAHAGHELASGPHWFAALFLLTHGAVKVGLVTALLLQKLWAYPWALGALGLFLIYQVYLLAIHQSLSMWFLTILDAIIIWLVWREWQQVKRRQREDRTSPASPATPR